MRILHLDYDDLQSPWGGGQAVRTFEINRRLAQRHQVTVVTNRFPGLGPAVKEGIQYHRIGGGRYYLSFFKYMASIPLALRRFKFDLLVEDFTVPISTAFTPLMTRKPVVASVQNLFAEEASRKYKLPFFLVERIGLKTYRNFVTPAGVVAERIRRHQKKANIEVIPNGVSKECFLSEPSEQDYILFLGRIDMHQKGLDLLLEAFRRAKLSPELRLVIAGTGPSMPALRKLVVEKGLSQRVELLGWVTGQPKQRVLSQCLFVCLTSRYECFSLVLLESFASGKPVVAFDIPSMKEQAPPECALLVPSFDVEQYSAALEELVGDPTRRKAMGHQARQYARRFDWDLIASRQEQFYREVLGSSGP